MGISRGVYRPYHVDGSVFAVRLQEYSPLSVLCIWPLWSLHTGHRLREKHNLRIFRVMLKCSVKDEPILSFSSFVADASH